MHAQCAVATLQLILIATRGHRAYTSTELDIIFKEVGREFFRHLQKMAQYFDCIRFTRQERAHTRDPVNNKAPVQWQRMKRL